MYILLIMAIGGVIGFFVFPNKKLAWSVRIQFFGTCLLIFSMGVTLGLRENFLNEITSFGIQGLVFALAPIACSVALVYLLTQKLFFNKKGKRQW